MDLTMVDRVDRRTFMRRVSSSAAAASLWPGPADPMSSIPQMSGADTVPQVQPVRSTTPRRIRFGVIGLNHGHITSMTTAVARGGGELVSVYAAEPELVAAFAKQFPGVRVARSETEILEDASLQAVLSASIPDARGPLGIRVMRHGKDFIVDKPGMTSLTQLAEIRKVQAATKRIYSVVYSERFENRATVRAGQLIKAGAIGRVVQTIGLGPHRMNIPSRPSWFFDAARYGGILCDIASHQADQFLFFTGSTSASVVAAQVGNVHYRQYPAFEDFGDMMVQGNGGVGYIRVDWFTPDGLPTWGDGRLTVLGTEGFIEIRKNVDIAGRQLGSHLFLSDQKQTTYIDTSSVVLPYGEQIVDDIVNRTETTMPQAHCFLAMELVITAQAKAARLTLGT
jgi:predicted dehydrogenase